MGNGKPGYNWHRAIFRYCFVLGLVMVLAITVAVGPGEGIPDPMGPCFNPGLRETLSFLSVLSIAMAVLEGLNWAVWSISRRVDLLIPVGWMGVFWSFGLLCVWFGLRGPSPCRLPDSGIISAGYLVGALALGCALLVLFEVILHAPQKRPR